MLVLSRKKNESIVINEDIEESVANVQAILAAERLRRERQIGLDDFVKLLREGR